MKKYTVIWSDNNVNKLQRVLVSSMAILISSKYGRAAQYIFDGWPKMHGEIIENGYDLPIVELKDKSENK